MTKRKQIIPARSGRETADAVMGDLIAYMRTCSDSMLEQFEMARLNTSANLVKDLNHIMQRAVNDLGEALLARTLREHRKAALAKARAGSSGSAHDIIADVAALIPALPAAKLTRGKK